MVADDPAARPAPEKLAAVDEVREVTPDGPCRALDLVGGAPPSAEQGDVTPPHRGPGLAGRAFLKRSPSRELRGLPDLEPAAAAPRKPPPVKSPPRPARALGATPPLRCRQLGIDVNFQAREASEPTTPGDLRSLAIVQFTKRAFSNAVELSIRAATTVRRRNQPLRTRS